MGLAQLYFLNARSCSEECVCGRDRYFHVYWFSGSRCLGQSKHYYMHFSGTVQFSTATAYILN